MSAHARSDADLVAAFTADADESISAAEFVRQRAHALRPQPDRQRSRWARLAPLLAVTLIVAVAAVITISRSTGGGTTRPSGTSDCAADFRLAEVAEQQSSPPNIEFSLTYTGSS